MLTAENQKIRLFNYLVWLTLQEASGGWIKRYPPYLKSVTHKRPPNRTNGEMPKILWRMQRQMSSLDPAEETYSGEEGAVAISGSAFGLGNKKSTGRKEKLCLRGIQVFIALSASPLGFIRRSAPSLWAKPTPLEGEQRKQRLESSSIQCDVASSNDIAENLYPLQHQLLLFSFYLSFIIWFKNTSSPPAEGVRGTFPPLSPVALHRGDQQAAAPHQAPRCPGGTSTGNRGWELLLGCWWLSSSCWWASCPL